jgi:hypothetical protein
MYIMKGGRGIFIDANNEATFNNFINNCTFEYYRHGVNGVVFIASLNPGIVSNYKYLDAYTFGRPVTKLIIKACFITEDFSINEGSNILDRTNYEEFKNEVNIQTDIFLKTMNYLQPLCPAIVYANVFDSTNNLLLNIVQKSIEILSSKEITSAIEKKFIYLKKIEKVIKKGEIKKYGIIAMELADGYNSLYKEIHENPLYINNEDNKRQLQNMVRYMLVELAVKTGYNHGDYHANNVLINLKNDTYFKGLNGEPLLIDFGYTVKLPENTMTKIKELYNNEDYEGILDALCLTPRADGKMINQEKYSDLFGYICDNSNASNRTENNNQIKNLIQRKQEATDDIIQLFNSKTDENENYPMLPLSNKIKNQMYVGMLDTTPLKIIKIPELDLNFHLFKKPKYLPVIIDWLYYVCSKTRNLDNFINCCYYYIYLVSLYNPDKLHWYLFALVIFYKFDIVTNVEVLNNITGNSYTEETINTAIIKLLPDLNVSILTFDILLTDEGVENFLKYVKNEREHFVRLMSNLLTYTNIRLTAAHFGIRQNINNGDIENYEFPFQEEEIGSKQEQEKDQEKENVELPLSVEPPKIRSRLADVIREDMNEESKGGKTKKRLNKRRKLTKNKRRLDKGKNKSKRRLTKKW